MTRLHLTRDSVAAGDDVYAPHAQVVDLPRAVVTAQELVACIAEVSTTYLPSVNGQATWAAFSNIPLAVFSNRAATMEPISAIEIFEHRLDRAPDGFRIHFVYFGAKDPWTVREVLEATLAYNFGPDRSG